MLLESYQLDQAPPKPGKSALGTRLVKGGEFRKELWQFSAVNMVKQS